MIRQLLRGFLFNSPRSPNIQKEVDQQTSRLALYNLTFCPYCIKVRLAIHSLHLKIRHRDIDDVRWGDELVQMGGKFQAPCLRIEAENGTSDWLYESSSIINYLEKRFPLSS